MQPLLSKVQLGNRSVVACSSNGQIFLAATDKQKIELFEVKQKLDRLVVVNVIHACENRDDEITALAFVYNYHMKCHFLIAGLARGGITLYSLKGQCCVSFSLMPNTACIAFCTDPFRLLCLYKDNVVGVVAHEMLAASMNGQSDKFHYVTYVLSGRTTTVEIASVQVEGHVSEVFDVHTQWGILAVGSPVISLHIIAEESKSLRSFVGGSVRGVLKFAQGFLWSQEPTRRSYPTDVALSSPRPTVKAPKTMEFCDPTRQGLHLSLTSGKQCLVADAFGRVALFCCETLRCLWMWKGYRDAQVVATSQGVVIHAPRRGLLEIWIQGTRTRAWKVDNGDLLKVLSLSPPEALFLRRNGQLDEISELLDDVESFGSCESHCDTVKEDLASMSVTELWDDILLQQNIDQSSEKEKMIALLLQLHLRHNSEILGTAGGMKPSMVMLHILQRYSKVGSAEFQEQLVAQEDEDGAGYFLLNAFGAVKPRGTIPINAAKLSVAIEVKNEITLISCYCQLSEHISEGEVFESTSWKDYWNPPVCASANGEDQLLPFVAWWNKQLAALEDDPLDPPLSLWEISGEADASLSRVPYNRFVRGKLDFDVLLWIAHQSLVVHDLTVFERTIAALQWGDHCALFLDFFFTLPLPFVLQQRVTLKGDGELWTRRASGNRSPLMRLCARTAEQDPQSVEVALGSGPMQHACLLALYLTVQNPSYSIWSETLIQRCVPLATQIPFLCANRVAFCLPAVLAINDITWKEDMISDGPIPTSFGGVVDLRMTPLRASIFVVLALVWKFLRDSGQDRLSQCLDAVNALAPSVERSALSYVVLHHCFLSRVEKWREQALHDVSALPVEHINSALCLVQDAVAPSPSDDIDDSLAALWGALVSQRGVLEQASFVLRILHAIACVKLSWDIDSLGPLSSLPFIVPLSSTRRCRRPSVAMDVEDQRRMFLISAATTCSPEKFRCAGGFQLLKDLACEQDVLPAVIAAKVYMGQDDDIEAFLDGGADHVYEPLVQRVGAVLDVLCTDASSHHATIMCSVSTDDLDFFLKSPIDARSTAHVEKVGEIKALESVCALCARPSMHGIEKIQHIGARAQSILNLILSDGE